MISFLLILLFASTPTSSSSLFRTKNEGGEIDAVYDMIERVLKMDDARDIFDLSLLSEGKDDAYATIVSSTNGKIEVKGTTASELSYGVGVYLREICNMTIGWPRGGGSNVRTYDAGKWPAVDATVRRSRNTRWSYIMNVCTHSYSLVWYDWTNDWEPFIDWMALSGINLFLAMTGQEEIQYKVFRKFGLEDADIRGWFNGPAFLTWSRGQNEYGAGIAGPLPRSWMKQQWVLQRQILNRTRSLGITGQLPGFQGNVPVQLVDAAGDANITKAKDTGWMNSVDPLYAKIADEWMTTMIEDFGTDSWYQVDGYFNGGTAPWMVHDDDDDDVSRASAFDDLPDDPSWYERGAAAYQGLNRTDPDAVWSFQGWAFVGWKSTQQAQSLKSFIDATPDGKFNVIDMSVAGDGEWKMWNESAFWNAHFVWTTLHDFGGTDGMKGDLSRINSIPFNATSGTRVWGTGFTPEGIDQNPVYYDFMLGANWRETPIVDITQHVIETRHRRYGLTEMNEDVQVAWAILVNTTYSQDLSVQDGTGVAHIGGQESWSFESDLHTPTTIMCDVYEAWRRLLDAARATEDMNEPMRYDLVNLGREVLAQLAGPAGVNFTNAKKLVPEDGSGALVQETSDAYVAILNDLDRLVATDRAFLLGPWLEMARAKHADGADEDCVGATGYEEVIQNCTMFYDWNARSQLTTWNPTPKDAAKIPGGPIDYASKHWSGLVSDYYAERVKRHTAQAVRDAKNGVAVNTTAIDRIEAKLAYEWTTAFTSYPTSPVGDAVEVTTEMIEKYGPMFSGCA